MQLIIKSLIGGLCGASIISLFLIQDGFNPLHNLHLITFGLSIGTLSVMASELLIGNKPRSLRNHLRDYAASLPASDTRWDKVIDLLAAIDDSENQPLTAPRFPQKRRT